MSGEIKIPDEQFGRKVGKHAAGFGLDPSDPTDRARFRNRIEQTVASPDKVVNGTFRDRGAVKFFVNGEDMVVTTPSNVFVTILKGGVTNPSARKALADG